MTFRWNNGSISTVRFWDHNANGGKGAEAERTVRSDRDTVRNYNLCKVDDLVSALCRVVSELVDIEEARAKKDEDERITREVT